MLFGWYIIGYLFLAGAGSGAFFVSACCCIWDALRGSAESEHLALSVQPGFYLAPCFMLVSVLFLLLDLGNAGRAWQIALSPFASIMSLGAWFVGLLTVLSTVLACVGIFLREVPRALLWAGCIVGGMLALGVMSYTGLLLSTMPGIDFWCSPWLVALFVASSLSTGSAVLLLSHALASPPSCVVSPVLRRWAWAFSCVEACVLLVFMATQFGFTETARDSCWLLLSGALAPVFWGCVCALGLAVPIFAGSAFGVSPFGLAGKPSEIVSATGVLTGGLALRYCIVAAALYTPLALGVAAF